jgi:hypothetical protein
MRNFINYASAHLAELGLSAADLAPIQAREESWEAASAAFVTARARFRSARQVKDDERGGQQDLVRPLVAVLQASPIVTDAHKAALGLTVRATTRTASPIPTSTPMAIIDTSQGLRHTVSLFDETTRLSRAKPRGVSGCEIWIKIGEPAPAGPSELKYFVTATRTPYVVEFEGADAGKVVYYMLRWVNTRGERGPWSRIVAATITR